MKYKFRELQGVTGELFVTSTKTVSIDKEQFKGN